MDGAALASLGSAFTPTAQRRRGKAAEEYTLSFHGSIRSLFSLF